MLTHAHGYFSRVVNGEAEIDSFSGLIVETDNGDGIDDDKFVTLKGEGGEMRDFFQHGDPSVYQIGSAMTVRFLVISRMRTGEPIIDVLEVWVGDQVAHAESECAWSVAVAADG